MIPCVYSFNFSDQSPREGTGSWQRGTGSQQRVIGPPERVMVLHYYSLSISVRNRGQLTATNVIQGPGHNFTSEDPAIFLEDVNITTGEKVIRPRQYPQVLIPSTPTLGTGQVGSLSMQDIQRLHQTTGEILARAGQQQHPQPSPSSHPAPSPSTLLSTLDIPPLEVGSKKCPVCMKEFREYNTQHRYTCNKCEKALGTKANLLHHQEHFHKQFNFVCIICQYSAQRKVDISKHMREHQRWLDHPELRCKHCVQVLHNKDGLYQHLKVCRHNTEGTVTQFMCRNPGCGSVFSLEKKRNYHEKNRCHLLKKNRGRGRGQPQ